MVLSVFLKSLFSIERYVVDKRVSYFERLNAYIDFLKVMNSLLIRNALIVILIIFATLLYMNRQNSAKSCLWYRFEPLVLNPAIIIQLDILKAEIKIILRNLRF